VLKARGRAQKGSQNDFTADKLLVYGLVIWMRQHYAHISHLEAHTAT
jgi:hypothetical protein